MLVELVVENYAVIDHLRVRFHPGLNLLTGETGSGKSIVVDSLALLWGGRASVDMIRSGADRARISGIFEVPQRPGIAELLAQAGIEPEAGELILEREILAGGKSRAFAGSRPVTAALLRELAPYLGDIHGQHDQQQLFSAAAQLEILDAFAGHQDLVDSTDTVFERWDACTRELVELERSEKETLRMADLWEFQRREIETAAPRSGEDRELEGERQILTNVARLEEQASAAFEALYEAPASALALARQARRRLEEIARIDPAVAGLLESLRPAELAIEEAAHGLRHYLGGLEADPVRLDQVESRLAELDKLRRKYGASIDEVLAFLDQVRNSLDALETSGERCATLTREREQLAAAYRETAEKLAQSRRRAAGLLAARVREELASLAMEKAVFRIEFSDAPWSRRGSDKVDFLVSLNPGEHPRPLESVASGGEISRIALALKSCIASAAEAGRQTPRTLVFDEVDAGIGGAAAETVGRRLKQLAGSHQVLCVTHLPQIAGFADHHYAVSKRELRGRTAAAIEELDPAARTREIGRMLSGQRLTPEALRHAEQLLKMAADSRRPG